MKKELKLNDAVKIESWITNNGIYIYKNNKVIGALSIEGLIRVSK